MSQKKRINRRAFLKKAGGAVVGAFGFPYIVPSSALGKSGGVAPSNRITLGCIGMGGQGTWDMSDFLRFDDVQVVAVCDVNSGSDNYDQLYQFKGCNTAGREPARRRVEEYYAEHKPSGSYKGCAGYADFRELLGRDDIDAILTATPDHWHGIIGVMSARAGKDVYAEKPLAYTIAEGRAIADAVKKYGVVWQTGSQQRSDQNFHRACELVRNGRIGEVCTIEVGLPYGNGLSGINSKLTEPAPVPKNLDYDMWLGPAPEMPYSPGRCHWHWRWIRDYAGGQITDWAGHHCDIVQWAMGTEHTGPIEIEGVGEIQNTKYSPYNTVESYRFECKYAEGFTMIVTDQRQRPKNRRGVLFKGSEGWIFVNRKGLELYPESLSTTVIRPSETHLYKSNNHIGNFIECIKSRSRTVAPAEIAHRSISVGHLGLIAIELHRKVNWDPVKERFINDSEANRLLSRPMRSPWHL